MTSVQPGEKHRSHIPPWTIATASGGDLRGGDLSYDREKNAPLANLFVSLLQNVGVETDRFASGTGTLTGLEA
ncbi:hypothetical protein [Alienimonas chondri]|uniref:Uncharacterized protein n=1 Tax=Alienimonas chondri TaxID=2681879 RepID=A0ABX1VC88_9PLAN|nr:hypothetical protein [Alienimonas chondri]NNJ24661.1 hypothetical protein [Alienimonas chondri]